MQQFIKEKLSPTSVKRKVLAGFSLSFAAILLALGITHFGFREMLETVDEISTPNEKLIALNSIFQEITTLDQLQRAEAIRNPNKPFKAFLKQSQSLVDKVDSLKQMPWDSTQEARLSSLISILHERNKIFFSYLRLKSGLVNNTALVSRIDTLYVIIENEQLSVDTSVVTTQKKTTTTYQHDTLTPLRDDRSRLAKLFSKKKTPTEPITTSVKVEEELSVSIDTVAIARQNNALAEVEKIMSDLEKDQRTQSNKLLKQETNLIEANNLFINQLLATLREVENEEFLKIQRNNAKAATLVTASVNRISLLLIVFFLGAAMLVYLIWVDIARSNYYKIQLEKSRDEAEELSQIKQRFLANMSHEIRTPLQTIIGFSEQLHQQYGKNNEAIQALHSSSEHLLHIVDEVLDYSRISSGNIIFVKENFELLKLVREVDAAMRIQADRKNISLLLNIESTEDYCVEGDPFRLRQILYNVVGNAIKFTSNGYVKFSVSTQEKEEEITTVFEISDTGIGIRAEDLEKIFNQFEQANALIARHFGGTGLGLTIVKSLIEAQNGTLEVESEPGQGATFRITIAYKKATTPSILSAESTSLVTADKFSGKVIVVDDDVMILRLCSLILKKNNIDFITYSEAEKLINLEPDEAVTHILMDIRMPHINGVELCQTLQKKYPTTTYFVALTAHVFQQEQQELLDQGFDTVLSKPFREQELLSLLGVTITQIDTDCTEYSPDLSTVRRMTLGDEALFQSVIQQFIEETESDLDDLDEYVRHIETEPIREVIHKLAGRVGQMGENELSARLHTIEVSIVEGAELADLIEKIIGIKDDLEKMLVSMRNQLVKSE